MSVPFWLKSTAAVAVCAAGVGLAVTAATSDTPPSVASQPVAVVPRTVPVRAPVPQRRPTEFLVQQSPGMAILDEDGKEKERLNGTINAVRSPTGRWIAGVEYDNSPANVFRGWLVIRPLGRPGDPHRVQLVFGQPGRTGCSFVWSADEGRVLICENSLLDANATERFIYRVYDLAAKSVTDVKPLLNGCNVTGWSADGKRFLADIESPGGPMRVAWLTAAGGVEYVSPNGEFGYSSRLSPDGRRVLYQGGTMPPKGEKRKSRLYVQNLATGERKAVDEPGETDGYCWSPDGSRVAYTWQRSLDKPTEVAERETLLITCDPDGRDRKVVTSRKYTIPENEGRDSVVFFFQVVDWR